MAYDIEQSLNVFDKLTQKITLELDNQYSLGRLKGTDYANVYSNIMNTALQLCIDIPIKEYQVDNEKKDLEVKDKNIELINAQTKHFTKQNEFIDKQMVQIDKDLEVKDRQLKGFDDRIKIDLFKSQLDSWSMMFSSGMLDNKPSIINNDEVSDLYNNMKAELR